jgi:ACR3 family arsenite efflux pump ArsB
MCPACYINGLLFLIFGASGVAIANNPWIIALGIILTIAGFWWMWRAYKKNKGKGGFKKNIKTTLIYIAIFVAGFVTASYVTHDYFKNKYQTEVKIEHQSHKH